MVGEENKINDPSDLPEIGNLTKRDMEILHDKSHAEWNKILRGEESRFTLLEVFTQHRGLTAEMKRVDAAHVAPIDALDRISGKFIK